MNVKDYEIYLGALKAELMPALGCTEPIALALAAARAREVLGCFPQKIDVFCSGNIIKNVKSVRVPHADDLRGVEAAVLMGAISGRSDRLLQVLEGATEGDVDMARRLLAEGCCTCFLEKGRDNLYVRVCAYGAEGSASVTIEQYHTNITGIEKNGQVIYENAAGRQGENSRRYAMSLKGILEFAQCVDLEDVAEVLERQIACNSAIAAEGQGRIYGNSVWRAFQRAFGGGGLYARAVEEAAAASEARMSGCTMPVVINAGSGNQGITVSVPVLRYAAERQLPRETLYRALVVSNLVSLYAKGFIGELSAFCGAVTAACGAGAAIAYLNGEDCDVVAGTIANTLAIAGGIFCDGAKSSCAAKVATSLTAAFTAYEMARNGNVFAPGDGIVGRDAEETIRRIGCLGKEGMEQADWMILEFMLGKRPLSGETNG